MSIFFWGGGGGGGGGKRSLTFSVSPLVGSQGNIKPLFSGKIVKCCKIVVYTQGLIKKKVHIQEHLYHKYEKKYFHFDSLTYC